MDGDTFLTVAPAEGADHTPPPGDEEGGGWGALDTLPGNPMMWILIVSELLVFGAFFLGYSAARLLDPVTFAHAQDQVNRFVGGLNTLVLITSGYILALAVRLRARGRIAQSRWCTVAAMIVGSAFLVIKIVEYAHIFAHGVSIETNTFFTLFFLMTGFHFMHVVAGLVVLALVTWKNSLENMETGAAFWHMVDLIWIIMYPLLYLIR